MSENSEYVATIMVMAYGRTTILDLDNTTSKCFDNTRLYQMSRKLDYAYAKCTFDTQTREYLKKIFRKDLINETTLDVIQDYIDYSTPKYLELQKESGTYTDDNIGQLYDPITFDKVIHTFSSESDVKSAVERTISRMFIERGFGVFLISVHEKVLHGDNPVLNLVYPRNVDDSSINLLDLNDYKKLSDYFPDKVKSIDMALAKINNEKKPTIPNSVGSHEKPIIFDKNKTNKIYIKDNLIRIARLSYIPCILRDIFGSQTYTNIMDYSCSVLPEDFPENEKIFAQYIRPSYTSKMNDIEMGSNKKIGGKKPLKSILKKSRKGRKSRHSQKTTRKKKRTVRFSKSVFEKKPIKTMAKRKRSKKPNKTRRKRRRVAGSNHSDEDGELHTPSRQLQSTSEASSAYDSDSDISSLTTGSSLEDLESTFGELEIEGRKTPIDIGEFESKEQEKLHGIVSLIDVYIFFIYRDTGYSSLLLNDKLNELDPEDNLYRKVGYLIEEVERMRPDSKIGRDRHRDVLRSLNIYIALVLDDEITL